MYLHHLDHQQYDVIITSCMNDEEILQFIHLISLVHDQNMRIILVVDDMEKFKLNLFENLGDYIHSEYKIRLSERLEAMLGILEKV
jgi:hypothetical protein